MDPAFGSRVGDDPVGRPRSETSGTLLPLCALAESPVAGGVAGLSALKLLRKSRYLSLPLELTGISSQSLSNWQGSRGHPRVSAHPMQGGQKQVKAVCSLAGSRAQVKLKKKLKNEKHPAGWPQLPGRAGLGWGLQIIHGFCGTFFN